MALNIVPADNELVERLQQGNIEAFDLLYEKYAGKLYVFCLKFIRSVSESEEVVQSVFLKIWENHKLLQKELSFKSYLFTIAYNNICKIYRKRQYLRKFTEETIKNEADASSEQEERIDLLSTLERVQDLISVLPDRQRTIFLKSRSEHKSSKEIAAELGLSAGTIDNYISDTLRFLRRKLKKEDFSFLILLPLFF